MEKLNAKSIYDRICSETPVFWKKVRWLMGACAAIGATLTAMQDKISDIIRPEWCHYLVVIGAVGASLSTLTAKDKPKDEI